MKELEAFEQSESNACRAAGEALRLAEEASGETHGGRLVGCWVGWLVTVGEGWLRLVKGCLSWLVGYVGWLVKDGWSVGQGWSN